MELCFKGCYEFFNITQGEREAELWTATVRTFSPVGFTRRTTVVWMWSKCVHCVFVNCKVGLSVVMLRGGEIFKRQGLTGDH